VEKKTEGACRPLRDGNNFVFNAFVYFELVPILENLVDGWRTWQPQRWRERPSSDCTEGGSSEF